MIEKIMEPAAKCAEVVSKECVKKGAEIGGKIMALMISYLITLNSAIL